MYENNQDRSQTVEKAKARYQVATSTNNLIASGAKVAVKPTSIVDVVIDTQKKRVQDRLNQSLYQHIVRDSFETMQDALQSRALHSENAFHYLQQRIADQAIPTDMRMHYVSTVTHVCGQYFKDMANEIDNFKSIVVDLTANQEAMFNDMKHEFAETAIKFQALEAHLNLQDINFENIGRQLDELTNNVSDKISHVQKNIGMISNQQKLLLSNQGQVASHVDDVQNMVATLFNAHATVDIKGFERNDQVQQLQQKLHHLQQRRERGENVTQDILQASHELKIKKAQIIAERENFSRKINQTKQLISGISSLTALFGHGEVAMQIGTIGQSTLTVAENIAGLMGVGALAATINPIAAFASISAAIANVVGLFGNKNTANPHEFILRAIRQLSSQIDNLSKQMEAHFDEVFQIIGENQRDLLMHFAEIHRAQAETTYLLRTIYFAVQTGFAKQSDALIGIMQSMSKLQNQLQLAPYHNDLDELAKILRHVTERGSDNYAQTANALESIGLTYGLTHQLEHPMAIVNPRNTVDYFHATNYFSHLVNKILELKQENANMLANPVLTTYACAINIMLALREYPESAPENIRERISERDINGLQKYEFMLSNLFSFIHQARDTRVIQVLLKNYSQAAQLLAEAIRIKTQEIERQVTLDMRMQLEQRIQQQSNQEVGLFNQAITTQVYNGWFSGEHIHDRRWHTGRGKRTFGGKAGEWHAQTVPTPYTEQQELNAYSAENKRQIDEQKQAHLQRCTLTLSRKEAYRLSVYNPTYLENLHGVKFILPEQEGFPILPAPQQLLPDNHPQLSILNLLIAAQAYGIGYIKLTYEIKENLFSLKINFKCFDASRMLTIANIVLDYDPLFYLGQEAVWWYWMGGNLVTHPEGVAINKELSRWHGGHNGGEHEIKSIQYKQPQARENRHGEYNKFLENRQTITLQINTTEFAELQLLFSEAEHKFKHQVFEELYQTLQLSNNSELGQACQNFESAYRDIYGLLCHAHHDTMQNSDSKLARWFAKHATSLAQINMRLKNKNITTCISRHLNEMNADLNQLSEIIAELNQSLTDKTGLYYEPDFGFLSATQLMLDWFLIRYKSHAVSFNKNYADSKDRGILEDILYDTVVNMTAALLQNAKPEIAVPIVEKAILDAGMKLQDVGPAAREDFIQRLSMHFNNQGLKLQWHGAAGEKPRLLLAPEKSREPYVATPASFFQSEKNSKNDSENSTHRIEEINEPANCSNKK